MTDDGLDGMAITLLALLLATCAVTGWLFGVDAALNVFAFGTFVLPMLGGIFALALVVASAL